MRVCLDGNKKCGVRTYQNFLALVILLSLAGTCRAANSEAKADAVVELILSQQNADPIERRMRDSFDRYISALELTESQKPVAEKYRMIFEGLILKAASKDRFRSEMKKLYADMYTASELDELLAFYNTALGKKVLIVTPVITREIESASQAYLEGDLKPELISLLGKMQNELAGAR